MLSASSGTSVSPEENIEAAKQAKKDRHHQIVGRWRIAVGILFMGLVVAALFYAVKGINWLINSRSSNSNAPAPILYQVKGTTEPGSFTTPSGEVISQNNIRPVCSIVGDTSACPMVPLDQQAVSAITQPRPGATSGITQSGTGSGCPDFLGDRSACVPDLSSNGSVSRDLSPIFNNTAQPASRPTGPSVLGASTTSSAIACPDFLGDTSACVPDLSSTGSVSRDLSPIFR